MPRKKGSGPIQLFIMTEIHAHGQDWHDRGLAWPLSAATLARRWVNRHPQSQQKRREPTVSEYESVRRAAHSLYMQGKVRRHLTQYRDGQPYWGYVLPDDDDE